MTKSLEPDRVERLRKKLYEKAKREPDFRFYSLYDKVCWIETLERAYRQAKANAGAAGVDGVRFEDIEAYGVERWLAELRQGLMEETYRPAPVRRVMIPKPGGGERALGIPTIRDRVVQTAVVLLLEPIFEPDFEDNVYAYRPQRSAHDALAEVQRRLYGGQQHVVDADVAQYFDTIPHAELLQSVARRVADGKILHLLKLWLKSPVEERDERGNRRMTGGKKSKQGTPQGGVVSPLLANIYINRLLRHWRKSGASERLGDIVSYADDFVILCASRRQAEESLLLVSRWLAKLGLAIHPTKTRLCHAREEPFDFLGHTFGPARHWRTGKRFISVHPSKKAQKRLKEKINTLLHRGNPTPWPELRDRLNRLLLGWVEYFSFGQTNRAYSAIWWHVSERVRRFLCRRHKLRVAETGRFGIGEIYGEVGIVNIQQTRLKRRPAHALS
ncbi:MAG: group II intron reverse transcriptase/maturase [Actinomycetota bacterium]|nr:group II intron reverse transcriptase/maturase [Actinomycetota bacterium]